MSADDLSQALSSLFVVALVAALAPLVVGLLARLRVPQVVVLIVGGVVIGPQVLGWAEPASIGLLANVGLGFLFLLAGYELDLTLFRQKAGRLALVGWAVTVVLALAVVGLLEAAGLVRAFVPVALALTTTALGTLLPILRDNDMLGGPFGRYVLAAGAVGEFLPVVAIAIFLGANGKFLGLISLCAVGVLALLLTLAPRLVPGRVARIMREGEHATAQTTLRWTVALLLLLLVVANDFGLDVVLGAFLAGVVLRRWAPGDVHALEEKLDAVGYGFFIPVFFVASGMGLDLRSIVEAPGRLLLFFVLLLVVRGLPTLLVYRTALPLAQRVELVFLAATALPLLVALSAIGLATGTMLPENAAALVGAGVLSVLVFPAAAVAIHRRHRAVPGRAQRRSAGAATRAELDRRGQKSSSRSSATTDPRRRLDQREVGERLREVPEVPAGVDVELLRVEPERRGDPEQPLHEVARALLLADDRQRGDQPEGADEEGPLLAGQAVVGLVRPVPQDEAVLGQLVGDGEHAAVQALVVARQEPEHRGQQRRGVQRVGLVVLAQHAAGGQAVGEDVLLDLVRRRRATASRGPGRRGSRRASRHGPSPPSTAAWRTRSAGACRGPPRCPGPAPARPARRSWPASGRSPTVAVAAAGCAGCAAGWSPAPRRTRRSGVGRTPRCRSAPAGRRRSRTGRRGSTR